MKIRLILSVCLLVPTLFGQNLYGKPHQHIRCGTTEYMNNLKQNDPKLNEKLNQAEQIIQQWMSGHPNYRTSSTVPDTIPIVVHVVYQTALQNISDAQVISQIDVLNEDFARTNADSVNTPAIWQAIAGRLPYYFVLARRDPNGNPTNGIVRTPTSSNTFSTNNAIKFDSQGGSNAWDVNTYFNIWVGNLGGGLLGYGEFPTGTPSNTFGFVCLYDAFGRVGTVTPPYHLGRTTTHEIGHCFDLFHIWGDDGGACSGDDLSADTPNQADATFGCLTYPALDACATSSPGFMFMNYMDYSDDNCLNMFTQNQASRMVAAVNSFYPTLLNSIGTQPVVLQANDAGSFAVVSPVANLCNTVITPVITLKNWGTAPLTSVNINYVLDNGTVNTYSWTGNLASLATVDVTLSPMNSSNGSHTFLSYTTLPNGTVDPNGLNDTTYSTFNIFSSGMAIPVVQNFSAVPFPPVGFSINNPDAGTTWVRYTTGAYTAPAGMRIDNFNYNANGEIDELVLPYMNLSSGPSPTLSFWVAYAYYTVPLQWSDTLEVVISEDCGVTWTSIYKKWADDLSTAPPTTNIFVPTASQWRQEFIDLSPFAATNTVIVKIRNITDYENNLYVDDINVDFTTAIKETDSDINFNVYPNPASDLLIVNTGLIKGDRATVSICTVDGQLVFKNEVKLPQHGTEINVSKFTKGIYFISVENDFGKQTKKFEIGE